jgi:DNA-binding response OmpR family regulator
MNVLIAKIQAMLRRAGGMDVAPQTLRCGEVTLHLEECALSAGEERIPLTKNEYLIVKTLFENKGRVISRERLMEQLWGAEEFVDDNTLTVNMTRIRKKLGTLGHEDMIVTKRGMGYIIEEV